MKEFKGWRKYKDLYYEIDWHGRGYTKNELEKIMYDKAEQILPIYMMATTAIHKLGDISSTEPDLCRVHKMDEDNYYGSWVTGMGYIQVRFPKATTRKLNEEEIAHYNRLHVQINNQMPFKLKVD